MGYKAPDCLFIQASIAGSRLTGPVKRSTSVFFIIIAGRNPTQQSRSIESR